MSIVIVQAHVDAHTSSSVLPYKRHIPSLVHLTPEEKTAFAHILSQLTIRYDNLFSCSFAYSMGIHQRPTPPASHAATEDQDEENVAHLHLHFAPPLLRSASVRKFLVGYVSDLNGLKAVTDILNY